MTAPANAVHEESTSTGTGNFTLTAVNGRQRFSGAFGTGVTTNVFVYIIMNRAAAERERGLGHMSATGTLVRDTVIESTNGNALVSFSAGTKDVTNFVPADEIVRWEQMVPLSYSFNLTSKFWGQGTSATPSSWTLTGASATVAKNTTGAQIRSATAGAALTRVGNDCKLAQNVAAFPNWTGLSGWGGRQVTFGRWVYATVASRVRIAIYDGTTRTFSSYHTGGSGLEFLTVTATLAASPTEVTIECHVGTGNTTGVFSGGAFIFGPSLAAVPVVPQEWQGRATFIVMTTTGAQVITGGSTHAIFVGVDPGGQPAPFGGVLHSMYAVSTAPPGSGKTTVFTNRRNNTAINITCTIADLNTSATDLVHQDYYAAGDLMDTLVQSGVAATGGQMNVSYAYDEIPIAP